MMKKSEKKILAYALANAISHNGKAQVGAVLPKLFQEGLKKEQVKAIIPKIQKIVKQINALSKEAQEEKYQKLSSLVKRKEERKGLPELPNAKQGKVVMRLAPFPSGPLHIGNARPFIVNDEYVKMYQGKLLFVIDDTIGSEEKRIMPESYKLIPEALDWLKIRYKKPIIYKSDRLNLYYRYAEELIKKDKAYVCFCSSDVLHENRVKRKECEHRRANIKENLKNWKEMLNGKYKQGQAILRIKTNMQHKNPAFRDRVLFRISEREHPKTKKKYKVWPLLEFSWAIDDHLLGITHILRGKDLMMESEMEKYIWDIFGWKKPIIIHTGLINIEGAKISKSKSQKEIVTGKYFGWDDPRTWSLQSLRRKGIEAEAVRAFCLSLGLTQTEATVPIENLYKENKKIVEKSDRYFFVANPTKIKIKSALKIKTKILLHPDHPKRGCRNFSTYQDFYIANEDYKKIRRGCLYRLMNLFNFTKNTYFKFISKEHEPKLKAKLIHWLPVQKDLVQAEVLMPDGNIIKGLAENGIRKLKPDTIIQFERFGFCRFDGKEKNKFLFWFGHR
ncbi:MAG: glutamate--tRNA ligase [Candidatus Pacearchaeota archaeon]|nr:MAG: glutamate--tRNA ligase [Candidatus Pacearchaeota archaeon]